MSSRGVFCRVFNESQEVIFERVTKFNYVHSEKVDDSSTIIVETNDISIVDRDDLQEHKPIIVVFGYVGRVIQKRKLYIWDIKPTFDEKGLRLEIVAYCKAAYLKLGSSRDVFNEKTMDKIVKSFADSHGLDYVDAVNGFEFVDENAGVAITGDALPSFFDIEKGIYTQARDSSRQVMKYSWKRQSVPQSGRSPAKTIQDLTDEEPIDNLFVTGRDDKLIISRRNFKQKPQKSFTYKAEPGDLLSFTPASVNSQGKKSAISNSVSGWDEENKSQVQASIGSPQTGTSLLGDMTEMSLEQRVAENLISKENNPFDRPVTYDGYFKEEIKMDDDGNPVRKLIATDKLDPNGRTLLYWTKRGVQPSKLVLEENKTWVSTAIDNIGRIETKGFIPAQVVKEEILTVQENMKDAAGEGVNRKAKKELELKESTARVLGDPALVSSKIITFLGLGKKYSGNYYVYRVEHNITQDGGYICDLGLYKNAYGKLGSEVSNQMDGEELGLYKNKDVGLSDDGTQELVDIPVNPDR